MTEEIWKDIEGYEGFYMISNMGRLKSLDRVVISDSNQQTYFKKGKIIVPGTNQNGYVLARLCKNGTEKTFKLHRVVANAFIDKRPGKNIVDHINGDRADNKAANLRWCTCAENIRFSFQSGREAGHNRSSLRLKGVSKVSLSGQVIKTYESILSVKADGYIPTCVSNCIAGRYSQHAGFKWQRV